MLPRSVLYMPGNHTTIIRNDFPELLVRHEIAVCIDDAFEGKHLCDPGFECTGRESRKDVAFENDASRSSSPRTIV
jgi:hypothetical protein